MNIEPARAPIGAQTATAAGRKQTGSGTVRKATTCIVTALQIICARQDKGIER